MSVSIDQWLRATWALVPPRCDHCGRSKSVSAAAHDGQDQCDWGSWCPTCEDPRAPAEHLRVLPSVRWIIGEVRPIAVEAGGWSSGHPDLDLMVWARPGVTIKSAVLGDVNSALCMLARARETYVRKPGEWQLELREDGTLWAPWCPVSRGGAWPRSGEPLPYRESTLAESTRTRVCASCSSRLSAGDTVWRPHNPGGTVASAGWTRDAHQEACVCEICARKVIMKGVPANDGGTVYGPLRVVGKDTTG